jgi:hypothetical protein
MKKRGAGGVGGVLAICGLGKGKGRCGLGLSGWGGSNCGIACLIIVFAFRWHWGDGGFEQFFSSQDGDFRFFIRNVFG